MQGQKAKILFIELPIDSWNRLSRHYLPNPGTLALATYMKRKGYHVKIIDTYAHGIGWKTLPQIIRDERPDIVGSSTYTPDIYGRVLLARTIKKENSSIVTIFGGSHMTLMPEETLRLSGGAIDYGVLGEGEETFLELVETLRSGKNKSQLNAVRGLAYLDQGTYIRTIPRPLIRDLNSLPMPDYSLVPMHKYRNSFFSAPREGFSCYFSRGCSSRCSFCSETLLWQGSWRGRSAEATVEELKVLNRDYGKRAFLFGDDNFLYDRQRNMEFIERMSRSGLRIIFRVGARVDTLLRDKDLLKDLRKVGMISLQIGIENFDQKVIDSLDKDYRADKLRELSVSLKKAHIPMAAAFLIVGNYDDSARSLLNFGKEAYRYGFGVVQISALAPWPGTRIFSELKRRNMIKVWDYRSYNFRDVVARTKHLPLRQLLGIKQALFFLWWLNPKIFLRNLFDKDRRRLHFYVIFQVAPSMVLHQIILKFKIWKLWPHNRQIDAIHREHQKMMRK